MIVSGDGGSRRRHRTGEAVGFKGSGRSFWDPLDTSGTAPSRYGAPRGDATGLGSDASECVRVYNMFRLTS